MIFGLSEWVVYICFAYIFGGITFIILYDLKVQKILKNKLRKLCGKND